MLSVWMGCIHCALWATWPHNNHLSCISTVCASKNMQWVLANEYDSLAAH